MASVETQAMTLPISAAGVRRWMAVTAYVEKTLPPIWQAQNRSTSTA